MVAVLGVSVASVAFHLPGLWVGPTFDGAVFTEIGVGIRHGLVPYVDLWDNKTPGLFLVLAAAQSLIVGRDPWIATWVVSVATSAGIGLVLYWLLRVPAGRGAALCAAILASSSVSVYPIALGGGQTEPPAALFGLIALGVAVRTPLSRRSAFVAGTLIGVAATFSLQILPAAAGIAVIVAWQRPDRLARLVAVIVGAMLVPGAMALQMLATGSWAAGWDALVVYNAAYAAVNREHVARFVVTLSITILFLMPIVLHAMAGLLHLLRARRRSALEAAAAIWVGGAAVLIAYQGRFEPHYAITVLPPLVILAVQGFRHMISFRPFGWVVATALTIVAVLVARPAGDILMLRSGPTDGSRVTAVVGWLRSHASPTASIFVWGNHPELYYSSGLAAASRYIHVLPLMTPGYSTSEIAESAAREIDLAKPEYIIDAGSSAPGEAGIVPLLIPRPVLEGDGLRLDVIEPIREVVRLDYSDPVVVGGWVIYRLNAAGQP